MYRHPDPVMYTTHTNKLLYIIVTIKLHYCTYMIVTIKLHYYTHYINFHSINTVYVTIQS